MYSHNQAPWAQSGPGNQMQQGPRPGSTQQAWGQQQQQPQPNMQNSNQFSGFNSGPSGQQPWNGGQQNPQPLNQASGQPWLAQNQGGPGQPQNFPPYYQQQAQQQPQQISQPQLPQQQQGQQQFTTQQQGITSNAAPWGGQKNQPWQQAPPQQQQMLQQQLSGPQGLPGPRSWVGTVTEIIPPNYGIVDGEAFFVNQIVMGTLPQVGEKVNCDAIVNTDGGRYQYRCTRVQVAASMPGPMSASNNSMAGFMGGGVRPMLPSDYKLAPPPTNAYQTDLALAAAANTMTPMPMQPPVMPPRRVFTPAPKLDEEARRRSEAATQQLMQNYNGQPNVGIKLMSKMGYGVAGTGLGAKGQGIAAPVQPVSLDGSSGLGFQMPPPLFERRPLLRRRSSPPLRRLRSPPPRRGRSRSPSRIRHRSSLSRSKSRSRSRSPRSPPRHMGRYKCEPPKYPPYVSVRTLPDVSKRYDDMYIPPEFCRVAASWLASMPDHQPLSLLKPIEFQVKKEDSSAPTEAADKVGSMSGLSEAEKLSGSWWSAKVVPISGIHPKVLHAQDTNTYQQPWKKLHFVVGRRGKHELMAVGGRWDPCDGAHPEKDPTVLVKTAARTFMEASGVDLSKCTKWDKFVEFSYLRSADKKHDIPEHLEKTVLFLVDTSPVAKADADAPDWDAQASSARAAEEGAAAAVKAAWHTAKEAKEAAKELEVAEKVKKEARKEAAKKAAVNKEATKEPGDNRPARANSNPKQSPKAGSGDTPKADASKGNEDAIKLEAGDEDEEDCTPRDSAGNELAVDIDTSKLTAAQLQEELTKRGMDVKWQPLKGKKVLVDRLQEWMMTHKGKKDALDAESKRKEGVRNAVEPAVAAYEEAKKALKKASADRRAAVKASNDPPPTASLALWPNKDFLDKRTKFGIDVLPLEALLNYSENDVKECHFEVSMFGELLKEMLQTRFARGLVRGMAIIEQETEVECSKEKEREREAGRHKDRSKDDSADADTKKDDDGKEVIKEASKSDEAEDGSENKVAQATATDKGAEMAGAALEKAGTARVEEETDEAARKGKAKDKDTGKKGKQQEKEAEKEQDGGKKGNSRKAAAATPPKETSRRTTRSSIAAKEAEEDQEEEAEDSSKQADHNTSQASKQASFKAAAEAAPSVSMDTEMEDAELAGKGVEDNDGKHVEGGSKGTKRAAEHEGAENSAASLTIAPSAKRQKTDADWGKSSTQGSGDPFLLACRFFDRECAGYLEADDLEEITFMVSDGISRRRVQTLVDNVTKHGKLRYMEHSQLQIPKALPPVAEEISSATLAAAALAASSTPAVSDKEWKTLLGKLASSEKVRRAADASIATKDEEAAKAAEQLQEVQAEEQKAQAHIKTLKEQLTGMRSSRFKANDLLTRGLDSVQSTFSQLNALKDQMEGAQSALRKVETPYSKPADGPTKDKT